MKQKIQNLLVLFLFFSFASNAQVLFEEDFESGIPNTFNLIDVDGAAANANVAEFQGAFVGDILGGQNCAVSTSWLNPVGITDDWMVTPAINITDGVVFLTFSALAPDPAYPDGVEVYVSTTGQDVADFSGQPLYNSTATGEADQWTTRSVDLSSFVNQTIYIAFRNNSNDDFLLGIDNIKVKVLAENDAQLSNATIDSPLEGDRTIDVVVTNGGSNAITSFDVEWSFDGTNYTENVTNVNLQTGQSTTVELSLGNQTEGIYDFSAEVTNVNAGVDPEMTDNSFSSTVNITVPVPDFSLTDSDGNAWKLYDQLASGKMVVLDFFASWCGPCQSSTPELNTFYVNNSANVDVFGITVEQTDNDAVVNGLGWGATYPKFSYSEEAYSHYDHYARIMGYNTQGSIPFFVMICPNPANLAYSEVVVNEVGFSANMFNTTFFPQIAQCSAVSSMDEMMRSDFSIFPNPVQSNATIEFNLDQNSMVNLDIVNLLGQTLMSNTINAKAGNNTFNIDVDKLTNGIYFANLSVNGKVKTVKITVSK